MNLYRLSQSVNNGYDTYDSCVVVAPDPMTASLISPLYGVDVSEHRRDWSSDSSWAEPKDVDIKLLGLADPSLEEYSVVISSYNAG